jgi:hypothetical protein
LGDIRHEYNFFLIWIEFGNLEFCEQGHWVAVYHAGGVVLALCDSEFQAFIGTVLLSDHFLFSVQI